MDKIFRFSYEKNVELIKKRGLGFEEIIRAISEGNLVDIGQHHNKQDYPNQYILYIEILTKIYAVPCIYEDDGVHVFLKTLFPSRKATKYYLSNKS